MRVPPESSGHSPSDLWACPVSPGQHSPPEGWGEEGEGERRGRGGGGEEGKEGEEGEEGGGVSI